MPRFPFKRSVGQDLRDLFGHDRLKDQERGLGYSSISPGEGSSEVLDAAGNTVAHFGHAAGKAGFLVQRGGSWVTVQEYAAAEVTAGTASLSSRMTSAEGRLATAEGRLDSHASRIGAAEGDISTHSGRLDAHATRMGRNEGVIQQNIDYIEDLDARVGVLEGGGPKYGTIPDNPKG